MVLGFYPSFANDAEELDLDTETCFDRFGIRVSVKCRGWFQWFHQVLRQAHHNYALTRIAFFSCYTQLVSCGIVVGIGWILAGILACVLALYYSDALKWIVRLISYLIHV